MIKMSVDIFLSRSMVMVTLPSWCHELPMRLRPIQLGQVPLEGETRMDGTALMD
jgi:hypothetical protein